MRMRVSRRVGDGVCVGLRLMVAVALVACGADLPPASGDGPLDEGADASCEASASADVEFLCEPGSGGACQNCGDCALVRSGEAKRLSGQCAADCIGAESATCTQMCLERQSTMTAGCAACFDGYFDCLVANCLAECVGDDPAACTECSRARPQPGPTCSEGLLLCSGLARNPEHQAAAVRR